MCGIAVIVSREPDRARTALAEMTAAMKHRGPDDCGEEWVDLGSVSLGLGFRRLSIIDLSPMGHQPMVHPLTQDVLIFNGEIYNFQVIRSELEQRGCQFRGHSDTEVLLHALVEWGPQAIERLEGMFAFAFFNRREQSLLLARDPLGIKPLYYHRRDGLLLAASEMRGILASGLVPRRPDPRGLAGFLAFGALQEPLTAVQGIHSVPPGCSQLIPMRQGLSGASEPFHRHWRFPEPDSTTESQAVEQIRVTMDAAVKDHLISDVPLGIFLSSGLDSTIVAGLAAKHHEGVCSFTVGFADQPDLSEATLADETARQFRLKHTTIPLMERDARDLAIEWMDRLDQPSVDGLNTYVISKAVRGQGMTVALSGQGGDELFGGYPSFVQVPKLLAWHRRLSPLPRPVRALAVAAVGLGRSQAVREKLGDVMRSDGSVRSVYLHRRRTMSDQQLAAVGVRATKLGLTADFLPPESVEQVPTDELDIIACVSRLESRYYQGNMLLRDSDANGMAHSLEIRVPFLDRRMLDLVYRLPGSVRLPEGKPGKHLLRRAFADLLRPELVTQKKRGFTLPIRRWMRGELRDLCESSLARLRSSGLVEPHGVERIWQIFLSDPESPIWTRAWSLVVLGRYLDRLKAA